MPIDPRMVAWDESPPESKIDPRMVKWDDAPKGSAAYQQGRQASSSLQGLVSVANGPLMGFADEALAGLGTPLKALVTGQSMGDSYRELRDGYRGMQDQRRDDAPWTTGITQAAASAPLAGVKLLQGAGFAPQITGWLGNAGRATVAGGIGGTIYGAGDSTSETMGGVGRDAAVGGVTSAAFGGALSPIAGVLGAGASNIAQRTTKNGIFGVGNPEQIARAKIAEAFARDARGETFTSGQSNPANQAAAKLAKLGDRAVVADAGGANTRQMLDLLASLPGRTKQAVENLTHSRKATRGDTLIDAAESGLRTTGQRLNQHLDQWAMDREAAAAPLYAQVRQIDITPSVALRDMVEAADTAGALKAGRAIANTDQMPFTLDTAAPGQWNMGNLDHVKKGMDQLISKQWDAAKGKYTEQGQSLMGLKSRMLDELDNIAPVYKQARDAYAGPSAIMDAANQGRMALSKDGPAISRLTGSLSQSEMQAFRLGAFESLRGKMGRKGGQTEILNMWEERATREKLKEVFGDEMQFRSFAANVARESRIKLLDKAGQGSQTFSRQMAAGDLDSGVGDAASALANAKTGNLLGAVGAAGKAWNRVAMPETTRDQMGKILLSGRALDADGNVVQNGMNNLASMRDIIEEINRRNQTLSNATGLIGSNLSRPLSIGLLGQ